MGHSDLAILMLVVGGVALVAFGPVFGFMAILLVVGGAALGLHAWRAEWKAKRGRKLWARLFSPTGAGSGWIEALLGGAIVVIVSVAEHPRRTPRLARGHPNEPRLSELGPR